jgi:hypothetical protein
LAALAAAAAIVAPRAAAARDPFPQPGEVTVDIDTTFGGKFRNNATIDFLYLHSFEPLDKRDEVVPALRRFVRHPSTFYVHGLRDDLANDTTSYVGAGGQLWLSDQLFLGGELGGEYVGVKNDDEREGAYLGATARVEGGFRPGELVQIGLYYHLRPVLYNLPDTNPGAAETLRRGRTHDAGLTFGVSTPDDSWYVTGRAGFRMHDWSFEGGYSDGDLTATGGHAQVRLSYQSGRTMSYYVDVDGYLMHWKNDRIRQSGLPEIEEDPERDVFGASGEVGFLYWFEGKWGFRGGAGGGFEGAVPLPQNRDRGFVRFSLGFTTRF